MGIRTTSALQNSDFAALLMAADWMALTGVAQHLLDRLGLDGFMKSMQTRDGIARPQVHVIGTLPPGLQDDFRDLDRDEPDPVASHVSRQSIPVIWNIDDVCTLTGSRRYRELRGLGICTGWSVAIRSNDSFSRVDVYSRRPCDLTEVDLHNNLLLFTCYLNDASRALWLQHNPNAKAPVLTEREQECLRWSASGKTSNEIGIILGISKNTVYFHLKKAASKFGVYGTRHAISRAMELRLI